MPVEAERQLFKIVDEERHAVAAQRAAVRRYALATHDSIVRAVPSARAASGIGKTAQPGRFARPLDAGKDALRRVLAVKLGRQIEMTPGDEQREDDRAVHRHSTSR